MQDCFQWQALMKSVLYLLVPRTKEIFSPILTFDLRWNCLHKAVSFVYLDRSFTSLEYVTLKLLLRVCFLHAV